MRKVWTKQMVATLRKEYKETPLAILAFKLGVSLPALKTKAQKLHLRKIKGRWTAKEDKHLRKFYPDHTMSELQQLFDGRSASSIYQRAKILGLEKTKEHLSSIGHRLAADPKSIACRFTKGLTPPNKGKRQTSFMSAEMIERTKPTRFKSGHKPHNTRPVGYESVRHDGYIYIKVEGEPKMVQKHRWLWKKYHGEIPKGMCVAFKDGNRLNCTIDNLMLITDAEKATRVTAAMTPEQRRKMYEKSCLSRKKSIRLDKIRIHWGLEPKGKLVKRW